MELELEQTRLGGFAPVLEKSCEQEETLEAIVPDASPDILRMVDTEAWAELGGHTSGEGRGQVTGTVRVFALYVPDGEEGVRRLETSVPFTVEVDSGGLDPACRLTAVPRVEQAEVRILNPRKVLVRVNLITEVRAYAPQEYSVCTAVPEPETCGVEQRQEECRTYMVTAVEEKPFALSDELNLPGSQPEMAELLRYRLETVSGETKLIGSKLIFKGNAAIQLLYRSPDLSVCECGLELPFSQMMEVPGAGEGCDCELELVPRSLRCSMGPDGGRTVQVSLELLAQAVLREERAFSLLTDLYSTSCALEAERRTGTLTHLVDRSIKTPALREIMEEGTMADTVLSARLCVGRVTQTREAGHLNAEAQVEVSVLFLREGGAPESLSQQFRVPCALELPEDCQCSCRCRCPEPVFAVPTASGIEVRFSVEFRCLALRSEEREGISAVRVDPDQTGTGETLPSIVLRVVGRGEQLWDIAKCYRTTVGEICRANSLEKEQSPEGRLLLIPRRRT